MHLLGRQNGILAFTFPAVVPNQHFIRLKIGMLHGTMTAIGSSHEFCSRADYVLLGRKLAVVEVNHSSSKANRILSEPSRFSSRANYLLLGR